MFKTRVVFSHFPFFAQLFFSSLIVPLYYKKEAAVFHCHKWIIHLFQCVTYGKEKIILSRNRRKLCTLDGLLRGKMLSVLKRDAQKPRKGLSFMLLQQMNILLKKKKRSYNKDTLHYQNIKCILFFSEQSLQALLCH